MNQPELGRKIVELRKAKGFTQEELVEKCNISVRTLQRIESGEATPRSYTIKLLFTALDYVPNDSPETGNLFMTQWLEQVSKYFMDIFNLKTNTMKKITILSIALSSAIVFVVLTQESKAQKTDRQTNKNGSEQTMTFINYSSQNTHSDSDELFGYKVRFDCDGVHVFSELIKINLKTREFKAALIGKFLQNKVEIIRTKEEQKSDKINCIANEVEQTKNRITFKGNVTLVHRNDTIKADEIIIYYK